MSDNLSFGKELPDQVPGINATLTHQITLLVDVRELIKERVALEKEYALRLGAIAKKAEEKRARHMPPVVLGDECSKAWTETDVRSSTLDKAYTALLSSYENTASDHDSFASALSADVADPLKVLERFKDESRRKQMAFFAKLVAERDRIYGERLKAKQKYDEECEAVETFRQKQERADDKHADRAAKQYDQQKVEMQNRKNAYLIQIAVSNRTKDRFYDHELPLLEDQFQSHHADTMRRLTKLLLHSQALQEGHLESIRRSVANTQTALNAVDPLRDQKLYAEFNRRPFSKPEDWSFEPYDRYYDTPAVAVEPEPKTLLQNKLQRSRGKLAELIPQIEDKTRDVARLTRIVESYAANPSLGNYDEVWENLLEASHQLTDLELVRAGYEAEIKVVTDALAGTPTTTLSRAGTNISPILVGDEGAQKPHEFKSTSFSIPAPCGYCKTNIWGLSKPGKTCKNCGISVHTRCELKMPAECGIAPGLSATKNNSLARASSINSMAPSIASAQSATSPTAASSSPPRANPLSRPIPPASKATPATSSPTQAKVLYDYEATSNFEVSITEGSTIRVIEPDDGSGWVKVLNDQGTEGLVPATYIEVLTRTPTKRRAPPPPNRNTAAKLVKALYSYEAQGDDELSLREGATYELTPNGENAGDGWWEGVDSSGKKVGLVYRLFASTSADAA
ncbi:Protein BZZ1 [Ceratobasidium theobromae]|uniref:Protein BZZ1 n=1 Tax=Ceratobasidium theobromae TaxID=1582974 RepID=A0A5N5QYK1_9AGAM|nr:Protein BZZ1 [Ceratobasidium theobromae]